MCVFFLFFCEINAIENAISSFDSVYSAYNVHGKCYEIFIYFVHYNFFYSILSDNFVENFNLKLQAYYIVVFPILWGKNSQ